jgi:hypothetical protein
MRHKIVGTFVLLTALSTSVSRAQQSSALDKAKITSQTFQSGTTYQAYMPFSPEQKVLLRDPNTKKVVARIYKDLEESERTLVAEHRAATDKAMEVVRSNRGSESEIADARRIITEDLDVQFEVDLDERKEQLKEVEKQLVDLREQLTRRQEAKSKLIELRMKLLENEAARLGFPNTWNAPKHLSFSGQYTPLQTFEVKQNPVTPNRTSGFGSGK